MVAYARLNALVIRSQSNASCANVYITHTGVRSPQFETTLPVSDAGAAAYTAATTARAVLTRSILTGSRIGDLLLNGRLEGTRVGRVEGSPCIFSVCEIAPSIHVCSSGRCAL